MDYPLNMTKPAKANEHASTAGFAVANDAAEHQALSDLGYSPKLEKAEKPAKVEAEEDEPKKPGRPKKS